MNSYQLYTIATILLLSLVNPTLNQTTPVHPHTATPAPVTHAPATTHAIEHQTTHQTTHAPATQPPSTHVPVTPAPTTHAPTHATEHPTTHAPVTQPPTTHAPVTEHPTTHAPVTQPPTTHTPTTTHAPIVPTAAPTLLETAQALVVEAQHEIARIPDGARKTHLHKLSTDLAHVIGKINDPSHTEDDFLLSLQLSSYMEQLRNMLHNEF